MYILKCADGSLFVESAWDLQLRLAEHNRGEGTKYTARRLPVTLVYCEEFGRIADAFQREKQVQGWSRARRRALVEARRDDPLLDRFDDQA
jgi:putative endonuclease